MSADASPSEISREPVTADPWHGLTASTPARLALGRAGSALPTREVLALALAHARARDAVHDAVAWETLAAGLWALGQETISLDSAAPDRPTYLRRPDFGRRLSAASRDALAAYAGRQRASPDVTLVIADGLSAKAVDENGLPTVAALLPGLSRIGLRLGPPVLVRQGRVAVGDEIGAALGSRFCILLIGERPGLSAADSLGAYLTFMPRMGRTDAERNCVSNIRLGGLKPENAAARILWLTERAFALSLTGVGLKDESGGALLEPSREP